MVTNVKHQRPCSDVPYCDACAKQQSPSLAMVTATCRLLDRLANLGMLTGEDVLISDEKRNDIAGVAVGVYSNFPSMNASFMSDDADLIVAFALDSQRILRFLANAKITEAVCGINAFFADRPLILHITPEVPWAIHHHVAGHSTAEHWRVGIMASIANLVSMGAWDRIGICHADDCENLFVDTTKNRSKKYCSVQCHRRAKIHAYRYRQRTLMKQQIIQRLPTAESVFLTAETDAV